MRYFKPNVTHAGNCNSLVYRQNYESIEKTISGFFRFVSPWT